MARFKIRRSRFVLVLMCLCLAASLPTRRSSLPFAQQPQAQQGQPLMDLNAKYVNGIAPGYWPTAGTGLTMNLTAGSSTCGNLPVSYAGGTLTLAASATNYVYLDTTKNCVPAFTSSGSGFPPTGVPIAVVTTSSSAITAITDARTWFQARPVVDPGGQVFNVKSFGAAGNGTTDDTAAIQAGLNQVCGVPGVSLGSGQLYFPLGNYVISSTLYCISGIGQAIPIWGEAGGDTLPSGSTILWNGAGGGTMMVLMGWRNSTMYNLDFNCNNSALYGVVVATTNTVNATLGTAVTAPGTVTVTPSSMTGIQGPSNEFPGTLLNVDTGSNFEAVWVTATTTNTFTATFTKTHSASAVVGNLGETGWARFENVSVINPYGTYSAGWLIGNNTNPTTDVPGIHWQHCFARGTTNSYAAVLFDSTGAGNVQNFSWEQGWINTFQHGFDAQNVGGYLRVADMNFENDSVSDIYFGGGLHGLDVKNVLTEPAAGGVFLTGAGYTGAVGPLHIEDSWIYDSVASGTYLISYPGPMTLSHNVFENSYSSTAVPQIQTFSNIVFTGGSAVAPQVILEDNTFYTATAIPLYDNNNNVVLPTYTANQPLAVYARGNRGYNPSTSAYVRLSDYMPVGSLVDESQTAVASSGVVNGGTASKLACWKNNTSGAADNCLSQNTSNQLTFGGSAFQAPPTAGTGITNNSNTWNVTCDPLNFSAWCLVDYFMNVNYVNPYYGDGWMITQVGGTTSSLNMSQGASFVGGQLNLKTPSSGASVGYGGWAQKNTLGRTWGGGTNWEQDTLFENPNSGTGATVWRIGLVNASPTTTIPTTGVYARLDPTLGTPDTTWHVVLCASGAETAYDTGLSQQAQYSNLHLRIRSTASGEVGVTIGTASEVTICASGCTITGTLSNSAALLPSYEVLTNSTSQQQWLVAYYWSLEMTGVSR